MAHQFDHEDCRGRRNVPAEIELYPLADWAPVMTESATRSADPAPLVTESATRSRTSVLDRRLVEEISFTQRLDLDRRLAHHATGPELFAMLARLDPDTISDAALVEVAAGADRVEAAAHAMKLRAAASLAERRSMRPQALSRYTSGPTGVAGDELKLRLRTSAKAGADLVRRGTALCGHLSATGDALSQGKIDAPRARVIVDGVEHVGWRVAAAVEAQVLVKAADRTPAQLRSDVARALIAVDATEAEHRARERAKGRRVTRPRAENDEMASMRVEGPAADVLALDLALDACARRAKAAGDDRTTDQLRFDSLAGIAHHALATGHLGDPAAGVALTTAGRRRSNIHITLPFDQLLPPRTKRPGGNQSCSPTGTGDTPPRRESTIPVNGRGPLEAPGDAPDRTGELLWPPELDGECLSPAAVPQLDGYGPISPATARALAAGGIWNRIVTDPLSGAVLDVGTTRYRPTQAIADHVVARDRTCVRPGCSHRADTCQLDHTQEYNHDDPSQGGPTSVANLGPLCARDHQIKTHGNFEATQPAPGVFEWTTPTGHRYRRERDGTTTDLIDQRPPEPHAPAAGGPPAGEDPPPF